MAPVSFLRTTGSVRGCDYWLDRRTFEGQARAAGDPLLLRAGQRRVIGRLFESSVWPDLRRVGTDSRRASPQSAPRNGRRPRFLDSFSHERSDVMEKGT